ncbi:MAG: hypothetical protein OQL06_10245 [Gammaproteobacteria bacterium]|nr:hypothetical protein [Gammaproteobacteria bacterium]
MSVMFSQYPGTRERHLQRKFENPLFGDEPVSLLDIQQAQQQDAQEVDDFMNEFRDLVQRAVELEANAEADVILKLKEQLDKSYERCTGLAGDQSEIKQMLRRLVAAIMQSMWQAIGQDAQAHAKLQMEEQARESHFAMLENPLISDLLRPDSCIGEDDLVPTLLSESREAVLLAMQMFIPEQQAVVCKKAGELIAQCADSDSAAITTARQRLLDMETALQPGNQMPG